MPKSTIQQMQTGMSLLLPDVICMHGHGGFCLFLPILWRDFFLLFHLHFNPSHPPSVLF